MTLADKCSIRNKISVEKRCLRKKSCRKVRNVYEMFPVNNCVPDTLRKRNVILLPIYHPYGDYPAHICIWLPMQFNRYLISSLLGTNEKFHFSNMLKMTGLENPSLVGTKQSIIYKWIASYLAMMGELKSSGKNNFQLSTFNFQLNKLPLQAVLR